MQFAARTHPGRREGENQDSIGTDEANKLWLVADGMGGHAAGALASQIVRDKLIELASFDPLEAAVLEAHAAVRSAAERDPQLDGMGSTVVAAQVRDGVCRIVWVGDSRAYLWRSGSLIRLTRDHSVRELQGMSPQSSSAGDGENADDKRIVQALGRDEPQPSSVDLQLVNGDRILLASDGLNGELDDDELAEVLASSTDPTSAVETLISAALSRGGRDNVSTIVVDVETLEDSQEGVMSGPALPASLWPAILVGVLLALIGSLLWWQLWIRQ